MNDKHQLMLKEWAVRGLLTGCDVPQISLCDSGIMLTFACWNCFKRMQRQIYHLEAAAGRIKINLLLEKPLSPNRTERGQNRA